MQASSPEHPRYNNQVRELAEEFVETLERLIEDGDIERHHIWEYGTRVYAILESTSHDWGLISIALARLIKDHPDQLFFRGMASMLYLMFSKYGHFYNNISRLPASEVSNFLKCVFEKINMFPMADDDTWEIYKPGKLSPFYQIILDCFGEWHERHPVVVYNWDHSPKFNEYEVAYKQLEVSLDVFLRAKDKKSVIQKGKTFFDSYQAVIDAVKDIQDTHGCFPFDGWLSYKMDDFDYREFLYFWHTVLLYIQSEGLWSLLEQQWIRYLKKTFPTHIESSLMKLLPEDFWKYFFSLTCLMFPVVVDESENDVIHLMLLRKKFIAGFTRLLLIYMESIDVIWENPGLSLGQEVFKLGSPDTYLQALKKYFIDCKFITEKDEFGYREIKILFEKLQEEIQEIEGNNKEEV